MSLCFLPEKKAEEKKKDENGHNLTLCLIVQTRQKEMFIGQCNVIHSMFLNRV